LFTLLERIREHIAEPDAGSVNMTTQENVKHTFLTGQDIESVLFSWGQLTSALPAG